MQLGTGENEKCPRPCNAAERPCIVPAKPCIIPSKAVQRSVRAVYRCRKEGLKAYGPLENPTRNIKTLFLITIKTLKTPSAGFSLCDFIRKGSLPVA